MCNTIKKTILVITAASFLAVASKFDVPALNGYREYRIKIRCNLNDTNHLDAVDTVRFPGGSYLHLALFAPRYNVIPEPTPSFYGLNFVVGQPRDTVIARFSTRYQWQKVFFDAGWIVNNPDSIWANARRYPARTDSTDWMLNNYPQNPSTSHGHISWIRNAGSMGWPYAPSSAIPSPGYRGIIYGSIQAGPRFKVQVDSFITSDRIFVLGPMTSTYQVAEFLYLRIGYDATGQGIFTTPIPILTQAGKDQTRRPSNPLSNPYFIAIPDENYGFQTDGRRIHLSR